LKVQIGGLRGTCIAARSFIFILRNTIIKLALEIWIRKLETRSRLSKISDYEVAKCLPVSAKSDLIGIVGPLRIIGL
jgi:hypothetical protein